MTTVFVRLNPESSIESFWDETQKQGSTIVAKNEIRVLEKNPKVDRSIKNGGLLQVHKNDVKELQENGYTLFGSEDVEEENKDSKAKKETKKVESSLDSK